MECVINEQVYVPSGFDKGQIFFLARWLGQCISKTVGLVGCSLYAVVSKQ